MSTRYMPSKKADQVAWAARFQSVVGPEAPAYGVPVALMAQFETANTALQAAWTASQDPTTRTRVSIDQRDQALVAMKTIARNIVTIIQGTPGVTSDMKIAAGVTVRKTHPTPAPVPQQKPFIKVARVDGRTVTIELRTSADNRAKPQHVDFASIYTATGAMKPVALSEWSFTTVTGKTTIEIPFPPSATGDTVWITAQWVNSRKESGPAATPVSVSLAAGGELPQTLEIPKMKAA